MNSKCDLRNPPRKRKESLEDYQSLFLMKAYHMITRCHTLCPDIACWTEDGKAFIVKDAEKLASDIIPTVYKHNKFSSFVRQLNLRKISKTITI
jgi:hypothetical protein